MYFTVSLLFKAVHRKPENGDDPLWEESIVLIEADTEEDARVQGEMLAKEQEIEYEVKGGDSVVWQFELIERVFQIDNESLVSGTEIFSRFLLDEEVKSILKPFRD